MDGISIGLLERLLKPLTPFVWRKLRSRLGWDSAGERAFDRLRRLLKAYEIAETQLARIVPEDWKLTLGELTDTQTLFKKLTGQRLEWLASYFGVCPEWLEGTFDESGSAPREQVHKRIGLYKDIGHVQHHLDRMKWSATWPRMTVFVDDYFDGELSASSRLGVVFTYDAPESINLKIRRHIVCGDEWPWRHTPARLELKTLARWFWMTYRTTVPLVPVKFEILNSIVQGTTLVESHVPLGTRPFEMFELYGLTSSECPMAKDEGETAAILKCYERHFGEVSPSSQDCIPALSS